MFLIVFFNIPRHVQRLWHIAHPSVNPLQSACWPTYPSSHRQLVILAQSVSMSATDVWKQSLPKPLSPDEKESRASDRETMRRPGDCRSKSNPSVVGNFFLTGYAVSALVRHDLCFSAPPSQEVFCIITIQLWKKIRDYSKKFFNQHLYMYGSHSIPVSVEFQHRHTSFYLVRY